MTLLATGMRHRDVRPRKSFQLLVHAGLVSFDRDQIVRLTPT
jgi:hypothetical protein